MVSKIKNVFDSYEKLQMHNGFCIYGFQGDCITNTIKKRGVYEIALTKFFEFFLNKFTLQDT